MSDKESRHYFFRGMEYYAANGCVIIIDTEKAADSSASPEEYRRVLSPGEFLKRIIAVRQSTDDRYPDEVREARRLLEQGTEIAKIAKKQGDMTDPAVRAYKRVHRSRPQIVVPGVPKRLVVGEDKKKVLFDGDYKLV